MLFRYPVLRFLRQRFTPTKSARTYSSLRYLPSRAWAMEFMRYSLYTFYFSVAALYVTRNHYSFINCSGPSMIPLLLPRGEERGDIFIIRKRIRLAGNSISEGGDGSLGELRRGMVVTFYKPTEREPLLCVKRIVALEGDVVKPLKRRRRFDKSGRSSNEADSTPHEQDEVTVPFGHVWVEGVNEDNSIDSNEYGPISKSLITGIATKIWWPKSRRGDIPWEEDWLKHCRKRVKTSRLSAQVPAEWAV